MTHRGETQATKSKRQHWLLPILLVLCFLVYLPGLYGGFLFDDFPNIVNKPELKAVDGSLFHWLALALSSNAGMLRRPISMLSFGLDYYIFGLNPLAFKLTNLVIHLVNGVVLYQLGQRLAGRLLPKSNPEWFDPRALALLTSMLWLLHPLNVSTVLYVVQRMDELAALFVLLGLLCYVEGRERMARGESGLAIAMLGVGTFGLLAAFSKENGALITAYALVVEACCYRFAAGTTRENQVLKGCYWLTVALPLALFAAFLVLHPQWLAHGYAGRDFTLIQRLLSEARILCDYLLWIFLPAPQWMGIFHDDFVISMGLAQPTSTLVAILFLAALVGIAWRLRHCNPGFIFALTWFLIGQSMESTIIPLELIFDHRNYLPMAGLLLGMVCSLTPWVHQRLHQWLTNVLCGMLILALSITTVYWAKVWGDPFRLAVIEASDHPTSARAQYEVGRQLIFKGVTNHQRDAAEKQAIPYFELAKRIDPTSIYSLVGLIQIYSHQKPSRLPEAIGELTARASHVAEVEINPLLALLNAAADGNVPVDTSQMKSLVNAALGNPRFSSGMRAVILNSYGRYMLQIAHDNQASVSLTLAAAKEDPTNPLLEVNLTKLAIALGDREQAQSHLRVAEQLDKTRIYTSTLAKLRRQLLARDDPGTKKTGGKLH